MGLYLGKIIGSKRAWYVKNVEVTLQPTRQWHRHPTEMAVAYVNNGAFDCVAVLFSKEEAERVMSRPDAVLGWVDPAVGYAALGHDNPSIRRTYNLGEQLATT